MKSSAKIIGLVVGIVCVLAIVVAACIYKDDIVSLGKRVKQRLTKRAQ